MENIQKLYEKLWRSLIRPQRFPYSEIDLGGDEIQFQKNNAIKMDFQLQNALNEKYHLSLYLPCDENYNLKFHGEYIVYCHTHSGARTEGLHLVEEAIERNIGIVLFDFRASGYSSGKYITLGWFEALDINQVVKFIKTEAKARSICLWGRSMGGAAIIFFMSLKYRSIIDRIFAKRKITKVDWVSVKAIDCIILDSHFNYLIQSIHNMVKSKTSKIPSWIISLVVNMLESEISKRTGIRLSLLNPQDFIKGFKTPVFCTIGNHDEMVKQQEFCNNFKDLQSRIKKFQIFVGNHTDDRPQHINDQIFSFIMHIFSVKKIYLHNLKNQPKKTRNSYSIFEPAPQTSYLDYTMAQIQINQKTEMAFQPKNLIQQNPINKQQQHYLSPIKERDEGSYSDLKKSLKKSKSFNPQDPTHQVPDNDFQIETEEELLRKNQKDEKVDFDQDLAENYIQEKNIPKASINILRSQKYTEKSYLRGLSFQIKKSTLRNKFRNKNNLIRKQIDKQTQQKILENSYKPQIVPNNNTYSKQVFVPEYRQDFQKVDSYQKRMNQSPKREQYIQSIQRQAFQTYQSQNQSRQSFQTPNNSFQPYNQNQISQSRQTVPVKFINAQKNAQNQFLKQIQTSQGNFQAQQNNVFYQNNKNEQNSRNQFQKNNHQFYSQVKNGQQPLSVSPEKQFNYHRQQSQPEFFQNIKKSQKLGQAKIKETETVFLNFNKQLINQLIIKRVFNQNFQGNHTKYIKIHLHLCTNCRFLLQFVLALLFFIYSQKKQPFQEIGSIFFLIIQKISSYSFFEEP